MNQQTDKFDLNRREFLRGGTLGTLVALLGAKALDAAAPAEAPVTTYKTVANPIRCGVIGCGARGREILKTLALLPNAPVAGVCDTYQPMMNRAARESAPEAKLYTDYKELLANKDVQAVILATPTHLHKDLVPDILAAGKHLYCETPLAHTVEDARFIARAAKESLKTHFQSGLQMRSDPQRHFLLGFIRSGAAGKPIKAHSQWHKKQSWRQTSPTAEREKALNWRLDKSLSTGIIGELGIHHIDQLTWFLNAMPISVTGASSLMLWNDGRNVPDTVKVDFEFPNNVIMTFEGTLANSFDAEYEILYGTDSAIMARENKAWMFKEVDAPMLGWEVYAGKDTFYKETGITLVANATKPTTVSKKGEEGNPLLNSQLYYCLENFLVCADIHGLGVADFAANFDINDKAALGDYLQSIQKTKPAHVGYKEGYDATVLAIKANDAATSGQKITFNKDWFEV